MTALLSIMQSIRLFLIIHVTQKDYIHLIEVGYGAHTQHRQLCLTLLNKTRRLVTESSGRFTRARHASVQAQFEQIVQEHFDWLLFKTTNPIRVPRIMGH